jgi:hypothetical protein
MRILLLVEGPGKISSANGITPLGNINPGSAHVRPNDHMHISYPNPANGGADIFPVFAMADGRVVMITEDTVAAHPADPDIQIWIRHTASITSYFAHQNLYSDVLQPIMDAVPPSAWQSLGDPASVFGQHGAPRPPGISPVSRSRGRRATSPRGTSA